MNDYKQVLANNSVLFNNEVLPFNSENTTETEVVGELIALASQVGVTYKGYYEGVLTYSTYTKQSVVGLTTQLDKLDYVDTYDLTVMVKEPFTNAVHHDQDDVFDFDQSDEFNDRIEFYIDVVLIPELVSYDGVYVDSNGDSTVIDQPDLAPSYIPTDDKDADSDDYLDTMSQESTPIIVKISNVASHSPFGQYSASANTKTNTITVGVSYTQEPELNDIEEDVSVINQGTFLPNFKDNFELITPAKFVGTVIKPAVYKPKEQKPVTTIVECLTEQDHIYYDTLLHEIARVIKVNSHGTRRIKMQCKPGYRYDASRKVCVQIIGSELSISRISHRQAVRTKKSMGTGYKRRVVIRSNKAKRFRKMMGLS